MFGRILMPVDGSAVSQGALSVAAQLAEALHSETRIIYVLDLGPLYQTEASGIDVSGVEKVMLDDGQKLLDRAEAIARSAGVAGESALLTIYGTRIVDAIVDDADKWHADLIALGTHGRHGLRRLLLGSVADGVARAASVPVLLVRGTTAGRPAS
ncbi:MAG: universal stress protein [Chloroflexota bacterium]